MKWNTSALYNADKNSTFKYALSLHCLYYHPTAPFTDERAEHRCENVFYVFFYFGHVFNVVFLFSKRSLFKKTLAKFRAASRLTRSTFEITATKQTDDFSVHVKWPEMPPYKLILSYYVWRIVWRPWRPFLGHQAWSWTTLRRGNVFVTFTNVFF